MLISTKPDSKGKEAVLYRCRQLTEFRWTPVGNIPVYTKATGKTYLPAGEEQLGVIYSSTEPTDKFITENISLETYLSIIANPDSALYHKDLQGHSNSWAYFGVVCNGFVRYALNIRRRYPTRLWGDIPGMRKIADEARYDAEQMALCDILHAHGNGRNHVAMVTDLLRDASGAICKIEVSEAVRPTCVRKQYTLEEYFEKYKLFALWRYDFVDDVPMPDPQQDACLKQGVPQLPVLAVDYGNKTNYRSCEDVLISVFSDGVNELEISRDGTPVESVTLQGRTNILRRFERGYYTVLHKATGTVVEFCVTEPEITYSVEDGMLTVKVDACDAFSAISHLEFRKQHPGNAAKATGGCEGAETAVFYHPQFASLSKVEELTDDEKETGVFTRAIPGDAANFKVYFENKYGVWTHVMIKI